MSISDKFTPGLSAEAEINDYMEGVGRYARGAIGADVTMVENAALLGARAQWSWPPKVGVADPLLWSRYGLGRPYFAQRGLVQMTDMLAGPSAIGAEGLDYLIVGRNTDQELVRKIIEQSGVRMMLAIGADVSKLREVLTPDLVNELVAKGIGFGGLPIPRRDGRDWLDGFIEELSHNETPAEAVAESLSRMGMRGRPGIVAGSAETLEEARLERRSREVIETLKRSPTLQVKVPPQLDWPLELDREKAPAPEVARKLEKYIEQEHSFDFEGRTAEATADLAAARETAAVAGTAIEDSRYTDVIFYETDPRGDDRKLGDEPLRGGSEYEICVAVRKDPEGVPPAAGTERRAHGKADWKGEAQILVVVSTDADEIIEIGDNFGCIALPETGDSFTEANIAFKVHSPAAPQRALIEVRLYHEFHLIDLVTASVFVVPSAHTLTDAERREHSPMLCVEPPEAYRSFEDLGEIVETNVITIDVRGDDGVYSMGLFLPRRPDLKPAVLQRARSEEEREVLGDLALWLQLKLTDKDLGDILVDVRDYWWKLVRQSAYSTDLDPGEDLRTETLKDLREIGRGLFARLIPPRGSTEQAHDVIKSVFAAAREGARVEILYRKGATNFVFPWPLIWIEGGEAAPISDQVLGTKFVIAQTPGGVNRLIRRRERVAAAPIKGPAAFAAGVWTRFRNAATHMDALRRLFKANAEYVSWDGKTIEDRETLRASLRESPPRILYFFSHGHMRSEHEHLFFETMREWARDPKEDTLAFLRQQMQEALDKDYIKLSNSKVYYSQLAYERFRFAPHSLVFLNMCESAQLYPGRSNNFISLFLENRCEGVIGTECPMTCVFADAFAREVFARMLENDPPGEAIRRARVKFLTENGNPLGLAYAAYGTLDWRLQSEAI